MALCWKILKKVVMYKLQHPSTRSLHGNMVRENKAWIHPSKYYCTVKVENFFSHKMPELYHIDLLVHFLGWKENGRINISCTNNCIATEVHTAKAWILHVYILYWPEHTVWVKSLWNKQYKWSKLKFITSNSTFEPKFAHFLVILFWCFSFQ